MKITRFEDLQCWQQSRELIKMIYELTRKNRFSKDFRLRDQIIGAGISVMNNIVEGFDAQSNNEFIRFLMISRRSAAEVKTCIYVAIDQGYITDQEFENTISQLANTQKLIDGLLRYLRHYKRDTATLKLK
ncbi:four helix bundle protein [Candidatus Omnitrophota bacterium]